MAAPPITITGLKDLQRALKSMDADLPKQLRIALNRGAELVIEYAGARFPTLTGRAKASLKARSSQRAARIAMGGNRAPYAPGLDFGGSAPRFPEFRRTGRYVYPGLEANRDEITEAMSAAVTALATGAGMAVD